MTTNSTVLTADFPRSVRGYSPVAVDDFIRQMGERLETLQAKLDTQTTNAEQLSQELNAAKQKLAAFAEKEAGIAGALVATEQRRIAVERELEKERNNTRLNAEQLIAEANQDREALLDEARRNAEEIAARAEATRLDQEERIRALCAAHDETVARIRQALEAQLSLLPAPGETLASLSISGVAIATTVEANREELTTAA